MARVRGNVVHDFNIEAYVAKPYDARGVVGLVSDLTLASTWTNSEGDLVCYTGMIVGVETGEVYVLTDKANYNHENSWKELGADPKVQMSVDWDVDGIKLENDAEAPGNSKLYGTNSSGVRGWYDIPTGGTPDAHHLTHEDGGSDEINVEGLSGVLADPQTPIAHALVSGYHTASGLSIGETIRATGPSTFIWSKLQYSDINGAPQSVSDLGLNSTDDLTEGSSNLYYTDTRVNNNVNVAANTSHRNTTSGNPHHVTASEISVADADNYYNGSNVEDVLAELGEINFENGFDRRDEASMPDLAFNTSTRVVTISVKSGSTDYHFWANGKKITKTATETITIPNTTGVYYIYFDDSGVLHYLITTSFDYDLIYKYALVSLVYWNATESTGYMGDERHGVRMSAMTHAYNHKTFGARYQDGLNIEGLTSGGDTYTQTTSGYFWDEDIQHSVTSLSTHSFLYRLGANGEWTITPASDEVSYNDGGSYDVWNEWDGSTWKLTEGTTSTDFWIIFYVAIPNISGQQIFKIIGQGAYANRGDARDAIESEKSRLILDGLPSEEVLFLYATIVKRNGTLVALADGSLYVDFRSSRGATGSGTSSNRAADILVDTTNFDKILSSADTNVQLALETLDDHTHERADITDFAHASTHISGGSDAIPVFTDSNSGLVPASGGGTTNYLRADGSWEEPAKQTYVFENGLTESSGTVHLGGTLTTNTQISTNTSGREFSVVAMNNSGNYSTEFYMRNDLLYLAGYLGGTLGSSTYQKLEIYREYWINIEASDGTGVTRLNVSTAKIEMTDTINNKGAVYNADYSANGVSDDRWIPDYGAVKAYADSVAGINDAPSDGTTYGRKDGAWAAVGSGISSPLTTKGDIWVYTTADARLPVGTNGQILSADSSEPSGLKWIDNDTGVDVTGTPSQYEMTFFADADTIESNDRLKVSFTNPGGVSLLLDMNSNDDSNDTYIQLNDTYTSGSYYSNRLRIAIPADDMSNPYIDFYDKNGGVTLLDFKTNGTRVAYLSSEGKLYVSGNTGIGASPSATYPLYVDGEVYSTSNMRATNFIQTSDRRLKKNIVKLSDPIPVVMQLNPVVYKYRKGEDNLHYGFIAQDVEKVLPDLVSESDFGTKMLSAIDIIAFNTSSIQVHETRIEKLERENKELKAKIKMLEDERS